ncbi:hypothetical protein KQJ29_34875, partial [Enterococcus sp. S181_ASV_20]|nr:hypothetical protein [Enterococcus sp. S181_ASV_20]
HSQLRRQRQMCIRDSPEKQEVAKKIMSKAILLAHKLSIKVIQVAGYDVYYEEKSMSSREYFIEGLKESVKEASRYGCLLYTSDAAD